MSGGLLFDALEGMLTWVDDEQEQTLYTKLTAAALLGYYDQDDVMATEFAPFEDVTEAALEPSDRSNRTFFLVPKDSQDEITKRFTAPDMDEASAWVEAINSHLGAIPDIGEYSDMESSQPPQQSVAQQAFFRQEPSQPTPNSVSQSNNATPAAPAVARLQPSLEVPLARNTSGSQGASSESYQQQRAPSVPQSRAQPGQGVVPPQAATTIPARAWDSPVVSGANTIAAPPPAASTRSNVSGSIIGLASAPTPAIRTTTIATYDEYRQGGNPANSYDNTRDWVDNNQQSGNFRRQTSGSSSLGGGTGAGNKGAPTSAWPRNNPMDSQGRQQLQDGRSDSYDDEGRWGTTGGQGQSLGQRQPSGRVPPLNMNGTGPSAAARAPLQQQNVNTSGLEATTLGGGSSYADGEAATVLGRKRSGMFVSVPANPQLNSNVAPNLSAMWKEWKDPVGDIYVFHEPTGSLHVCRAGNDAFETVMEGSEDIPHDDLRYHPYFDQLADTVCDVNGRVVYNIQNYGNQRVEGEIAATSADVYRSDAVTTPRGQYSPSRKSRISALNPPPRQPQGTYEGRRVHHLQIGVGPTGDPTEALITHQVQPLAAQGLLWDPKSGRAIDPRDSKGDNPRGIGQSTLYKQWEHVRLMLMQGRYFKKHAVKSSAYSYRFVFLTGDNAYVVCVPTSEVMLNVHTSAQTFNTVADTVQYYGRDARAIALNTITRVTLGSEEDNIMRRRGQLKPENTFCIVTQTHAFILECGSSKEAKYFADAWTFFMYHSKPLNVQAQRTKEMRNPVTHGTRAGLAF